MNRRDRNKPHVIAPETSDPLSQEMALAVGTPLICIKTESAKGLHNGASAKVQSIDPLQNHVVTIRIGEHHEKFTLEQAAAAFRSGYARTHQTAQAATLRGRVVCYEVKHPYFTSRHLLVGMSRATDLSCLSFFA